MIGTLLKKLKKDTKEKHLSDLLSFALVIMILNSIGFHMISNTNTITFFFYFLMILILHTILETSFRLSLGSRNIVVGVGSYILVAAIVATLSTFLF
ncbi:hypothetical protein SAMN05192533_10557 [Mesobacillus persicus]|uniref:Uncharacterized protein n=1 Tax=Mesobacillus persicus TaxID=930146 RepID=A0A1H8ALA5_9BACI|nr:hypothetical protein [Mesobacillus persicus]SEM71286.1 hypothetical protein SAMN05192533_10557 [Mesobacillus persicus]